MSDDKPKKPRGFAAMDKEKVREIARKGGEAVHLLGTGHEFTKEEARAAGKKGGQARRKKPVEEGKQPELPFEVKESG